MESRYKRGILRALDITGSMMGVMLCLVWILISDNKLVSNLKKANAAVREKGRTLDLQDIIVPELGQKYLQSCR
jgi:hypothetical protein